METGPSIYLHCFVLQDPILIEHFQSNRKEASV